jgi:hypothetical protein
MQALQWTTHVKLQKVLSIFRLGLQLSGSSGFFDGAGTRIMSLWPLECTAWLVPSMSTRVYVPGMVVLGAMMSRAAQCAPRRWKVSEGDG